MLTINIDMDGVLADFEGYCFQKYGNSYSDLPSQEFWQDNNVGLFACLDPLPTAYLLVDEVHKLASTHSTDVQILTALPRDFHYPTARTEKRVWTDKYFPELIEVKFGPYAIDKQHHCKPGDVLIDDNPLNIAQWHLAGGFGILHNPYDNDFKTIKALRWYLNNYGR